MSDPILYVEDGPDDVFFMQRAFRKVNPEVELKVITSGEEATTYFDATSEQSNASPLALVILDLNLPGRSGLEVLTHIRTQSKFRKVPVLLFSASSQQSDIDSCYAAGCNAYLVKPSDPEQLNDMVAVINDFWLKINRYSTPPGSVTLVST